MSHRFEASATDIPGVHLIRRKPAGDHRGLFARLYCADELADFGWTKPVAQVNQSYTATAGTLRGLHFQHPPKAEMKLVICLKGSVFDVAVDLRVHSPAYLGHHHAVLSADNNCALMIPEGCAHGFQTLTDDVELLYVHSEAYDAAAESGLYPLDPQLAIEWPLSTSTLSTRDRELPRLSADFSGIVL